MSDSVTTAWHCQPCQQCFQSKFLLISHQILVHKIDQKTAKLSSFLTDDIIDLDDVLYSSDSDCEYRIIVRIEKTPKKTSTNFNHNGKGERMDTEHTCDSASVNSEGMAQEASPEDTCKQTANSEPTKTFICEYCKTECSTKTILKKHMLQMHINPLDQPKAQKKKIIDKSAYQHACTKCGKKMYNETYRINHEQTCFAHLCSYCGKHFKNSTNLNVHLMSHTKERPFGCNLCNKAFLIKRSLLDHMNKHKGIKPYKCPFDNCDKSFTLRTGVRQHLNSMHLEKRFICQYCQHQCSTKFHLDCHLRTHTGEKPYKCADCSASFRLPSTFRKHQRVHTGERPFICDTCNKGFISMYNLKQHKKRQKKCTPPVQIPTVAADSDSNSKIAN